MKSLIATAILLSSSIAYAHDSSFSSDSCDVDLNAGLRISKNVVEFSKDNKVLYKIINDQSLFVNGVEINLDSNQQSLISEYSTSIREVVPEVKEIAVDAIDLAVDGVNLAFNELLGEGNDIGTELTTQLGVIRDEVDSRFSGEQEFYIDEHGVMGDDFFGEEFEQRIENVVEEAVQNSMGSLLIAVGQELLFSGGDMDAFETRMEDFGEQIEHEMESRGEELGKRGEALCHSVYQIDQLEESLKEEIEQLSGFNILSTSKNGKHSI